MLFCNTVSEYGFCVFLFSGIRPNTSGKWEGRLSRCFIYKSAGSEGLFARGAQGHEVPHQYADLRLRETNRCKGGHGGEDGWMNRWQTLRSRDLKPFLFLAAFIFSPARRRNRQIPAQTLSGGRRCLRRTLASVFLSRSLIQASRCSLFFLPFFFFFYDRPRGFTVHSVISCVLITR